MKNLVLRYIVITMLLVFTVVGCGENDAGTNVDNDGMKTEKSESQEETMESTPGDMSPKAKAIFDKFKMKVDENNQTRAQMREDYPNMTVLDLVEAESPDGLEEFGTFLCNKDTDVDFDAFVPAFMAQNYNTYYIECIDETEDWVELKLYGAK